jgi:DNA-binding NarL/FixJ family response regulator
LIKICFYDFLIQHLKFNLNTVNLTLSTLMPFTKILIADDHHLVADSLSILLDTVEDFEVIGTVSNGWQALNFIESNAVDVVLADLHMPLLNGIDLAMRVNEQYSAIKVIILTMSEEASHIKEALQAGIHGYVMKSAERPELIKAIQTVAKGEKYFSEKIIRKLAELPNESNPNGKAGLNDDTPLTDRELQIIRCITRDMSNLEIGKELNISSTTVETHRRNLMKKLGISTPIGLMRWALKHQIVEVE